MGPQDQDGRRPGPCSQRGAHRDGLLDGVHREQRVAARSPVLGADRPVNNTQSVVPPGLMVR